MALLLLLGLTVLPRAIHAQPVAAVPPGATAVTVLLCDDPQGCPAEATAMGARSRELGLPLMDFDRLALAGPGGGDAVQRYRQAIAALHSDPSLDAAVLAREALKAHPYTVPAAELFDIQLELGHRLLVAGQTALAERAFADAASCSAGRVHDLPDLDPRALELYFDAAEARATEIRTATLRVRAPVDGSVVFADGVRLGQTPLDVDLSPGWHRVTVETRGWRTAWAGELRLLPGVDLTLTSESQEAEGTGALEAAVLAATRGVPPDAATTARLVSWADGQGLRWVRFAQLHPSSDAPELAEEVFPDPDPEVEDWAVTSTWLDVQAARFVSTGPGLAVLSEQPRQHRFRLGAGLGYLHLAPRHHASLEIEALIRLRGPWSLDARLGVLRTGQEYYLYKGWVDPHLFPVSLGLRWGAADGGPQLGLAATAMVPYALGGLARAGWELIPTTYWRVGLEAVGGMSSKGWLAGGSLRLARRY